MWAESSGWIATGVGAPVAAVFLLWAALVLHCDRHHWRPQDPLLMALLLESVLQQAGACLSTVVLLFRPGEEVWCSALVWWLAAVRTLQAGTLATLAASRLLRVRYSPLLYHLVCLALLSACVGLAAVLARVAPCEDSPDRRYVVFSLALHLVLAFASCVGLICCCCRPRIPPDEATCFVHNARHRRRQLLNSSSDLSSAMSDVSMISTMRSRAGKGISHSASDCSRRIRHSLVEELLRISPVNSGQNPPVTFLNGAPDPGRLVSPLKPRGCPHYDTPPHDLQLPCAAIMEDGCDVDSYGLSTLRAPEPCYLSTSTSASSTHSRAPCLSTDSPQDVSLTTISAILLLCYSINHFPVLALTVAENFVPHIIPPHWPLGFLPLWAGLLEGVLLPVVLAMTDKAFVRRVATIYSRRRPSDMTKPPQGLHGKFRPFNNCVVEPQKPLETVRFPITNGSLFTSLDGRIPIIHNYRRTKGIRTTGPLPSYCLNQGLGQRYCPQSTQTQDECGAQMRANIIVADINCDRKTESPLSPFSEIQKPNESGQCYTQRLNTSDLRQEAPPFPQNIQQLRETLFLETQDSEDDYEDYEETCEEPIYATLSSRSACSATTAANDDFEFYQQESPRENKPPGFKSPSVRRVSIRRRISRSSSMDRILSRQETDEEESLSDDGRQPLPRPMYRQQPPRRPRLVRPLSRRLGLPPTPPPPRRLAPVLSMDSLVAALHQADISYLDTGDLCRHSEANPHLTGSVPDLKKVFYTGFL